MLGALAAIVGAAAVAWYAYRYLREGGSALVPMAATVLMVIAVPAEWVYVRIGATVASVCFSIKLVQLGTGAVHDRAMLKTPSRFLYWFFLPPDSRPAGSPEDATQNRRTGLHRIVRSLPKFGGAGALLLAEATTGLAAFGLWASTLWSMCLLYLVFSGLADVVSGVSMQSGHWLAESFDAPMLARSPRDFWGRRWNMVVHRFAQRCLFLRVGGRRHPLRAIAIIFAASGVMHEYLIVAVRGTVPEHFGWMAAFFCLHGMAVIGEVVTERTFKWPQLPRPLAVTLHFVWMTATAPLFLAPFGELFA